MIIAITLGLVTLAAALAATWMRLYVKTPPNLAFIRTGAFGKKVVIDGGDIVFPFVQSVQWLSLETFKLEVLKTNKEAFITKDRFRVDIGAEFYVRIPPDRAMIEQASRSLGEKSFTADGIRTLVEEKLISALRAVAASFALFELHENRRGFALKVKEALAEPLAENGLVLEDVSLFTLDQTAREFLDPNNVFDAEGLKQITAQTSERARERNAIERNTEVEIRKKDVEAVKVKLSLQQDQDFAEAEQAQRVETYRAEREAETLEIKHQQAQRAREAEIAMERAVHEAEIRRETHLIKQREEQERTDVLREQAVEEARRGRDIAIILKERERLEAEAERLAQEAEREKAAQNVLTVGQRAEAERAKEIALISALQELDVVDRRARVTERLAAAHRVEREAAAHGELKMREAQNALDVKFIYRDLAEELIRRAPEILGELMAPAKQIDSIRVLDVRGLGGSNGVTTNGSTIGAVLTAFLQSGAALPLLRELLDFAKFDPEKVKQQLAERVPVLREIVKDTGKGSSAV